ncbi:MAG: hypothetical protein H0U60_13235 [Blastocatellia bacterium]|nr:hypothetical protein [Blastocatellia bacterium]
MFSVTWMITEDAEPLVIGSREHIFGLAVLLRDTCKAMYIDVRDCSTGQLIRDWNS